MSFSRALVAVDAVMIHPILDNPSLLRKIEFFFFDSVLATDTVKSKGGLLVV
jgi:hypothetical protein